MSYSRATGISAICSGTTSSATTTRKSQSRPRNGIHANAYAASAATSTTSSDAGTVMSTVFQNDSDDVGVVEHVLVGLERELRRMRSAVHQPDAPLSAAVRNDATNRPDRRDEPQDRDDHQEHVATGPRVTARTMRRRTAVRVGDARAALGRHQLLRPEPSDVERHGRDHQQEQEHRQRAAEAEVPDAERRLPHLQRDHVRASLCDDPGRDHQHEVEDLQHVDDRA